MSSFINKIASSVTNSTSSIIGRENLAKLSNSINRTFKKSKYRDFMKHGNVAQIISKSSHQSLQICTSRNDASRLILLGNGQIGMEYLNAHFLIEVDPKNSHLKFKNRNNYMAYDNEVPCVLAEVLNPKTKQEAIRARNEFRLHEIIGSDEYFALESVYYPGRYLSILADGSITSTRDKADEKAHFCLHVINVPQHNLRPNSGPFVYTPPVVSVNEAAAPVPSAATPVPTATSVVPGPSAPVSYPASSSSSSSSKEEEAAAYERQRREEEQRRSAQQPTSPPQDTPPNYGNLFPQLPPQ